MPDPMLSAKTSAKPLEKPLLRGHFHQAAFFVALGACVIMLASNYRQPLFAAGLVYSLTLISLLGISSLYHRINWQPKVRQWWRRLDHAAIFILIAGTATPICYGLDKVLWLVWVAAACGVLQSLFWVHSPKAITAILYLGVGWIVAPYWSELCERLPTLSMILLVVGGVLYSCGALVYALRRPNPYPLIFGYHEIFHILVVIAAALHFYVVWSLLMAG